MPLVARETPRGRYRLGIRHLLKTGARGAFVGSLRPRSHPGRIGALLRIRKPKARGLRNRRSQVRILSGPSRSSPAQGNSRCCRRPSVATAVATGQQRACCHSRPPAALLQCPPSPAGMSSAHVSRDAGAHTASGRSRRAPSFQSRITQESGIDATAATAHPDCLEPTTLEDGIEGDAHLQRHFAHQFGSFQDANAATNLRFAPLTRTDPRLPRSTSHVTRPRPELRHLTRRLRHR